MVKIVTGIFVLMWPNKFNGCPWQIQDWQNYIQGNRITIKEIKQKIQIIKYFKNRTNNENRMHLSLIIKHKFYKIKNNCLWTITYFGHAKIYLDQDLN